MSGNYTIEKLLDEVVTLPSLPTTVSRVTELINDPASNLSDVAHVIQTDPALALKTLRLVNSAYYGVGQRVDTVDHAVTMLGIKVIRNLAYTAAVFETFQRGSSELLHHSVTTGIAMRSLIEHSACRGMIDPDEAFVYGLLHDVGKILIFEFLPKQAESATLMSHARKLPVYEAERAVIGVDHAELGSRLIEKWGLSPQLAGAIAGHHDLSRCEEPAHRKLAAALGVADYICGVAGVPAGARAVLHIDADHWAAAGINSRTVPIILDRFFASLGFVDELMRLAS
ncbi:MAG: HDOD domain-containing protein [Candidatus Hydrogenedentes bacterium]|nr:HDOD domain-containing protein [Candidatus Hydrogenedentota bacterium]